MDNLQVDEIGAEEAICAGEAKFGTMASESGELGILPGHTPLISRIRPGTVKVILTDDSEVSIFVAGGILEIQPGAVTVLSDRSEEHTSELQSLMRISYAVFCLKKKKITSDRTTTRVMTEQRKRIRY